MTLHSKALDTTIESGLIFIIAFTPLAFGAVQVWAYTLMEFMVIALFAVSMIKLIFIEQKGKKKIRVPSPLYIPALGFILLVLFQILPLPPSAIQYISPNTYTLYETALPGWPSFKNEASSLKDPVPSLKRKSSRTQSWRSISIHRHATSKEFFMLLSYIGAFLLIVRHITTQKQIKRLVVAIITMGFALSVFGIIQYFTWNGKIYWVNELTYGGEPFGPYVNRNHFAGYMEMAIPLAIGFLISRFQIDEVQGTGWRSLLSAFESQISKLFLPLFATVVMISALFLSLSRGGVLCFLLSMVFFFNVFIFSRRSKRTGTSFLLISIFSFSAIFLIWIGIDPVMKRLSSLKSPDKISPVRSIIYEDTLNIASDFPLLGTGLGTFEAIYSKYQTAPSGFSFDHAHNDYLELISDTGLLGAFLLVFGGLAFCIIFWKKRQKRKNPFILGVSLGGITGILAVLFHSTVDFNMHIPANAMLFFMLLGMNFVVVQMKSSRKVKRRPSTSVTAQVDRL